MTPRSLRRSRGRAESGLRGLAHYRLIRLLGEGGQGSVYLAMDTRLSRRVVIKLLHLDGALSERRHLLAEARRAAQLEGPRVAQVLDVVASGEDLAIVLRYVPGCNLEQLLAHAPVLAPETALCLASDLAAALAAARQQLLVHGDIKAANVLLGFDGRAVLTDFGVAVRGGAAAIGISEFALTPEHCRGDALTQQSDFFAVGLLLHRMLFGFHPFVRDGAVDRRAVLEGIRTLPALPGDEGGEDRENGEALRESIESLLRSLLSADPGARPASTLALRSALQDLRALLPPPQSLAPLVRRLARDERRQTSNLAPLPARLLRPPLLQQLRSQAVGAWRRASYGARAFLLAFVLGALGLLVAWFAQPGPCIALLDTRIDAPPTISASLPDTALMESHLVGALRREVSPVQVLARVPDSDSRKILRVQGLRDSCVPQQRLALALHCPDGDCRLDLSLQERGGTRRAQLTLPAGSSWQAIQRALDQLLADLLPGSAAG